MIRKIFGWLLVVLCLFILFGTVMLLLADTPFSKEALANQLPFFFLFSLITGVWAYLLLRKRSPDKERGLEVESINEGATIGVKMKITIYFVEAILCLLISIMVATLFITEPLLPDSSHAEISWAFVISLILAVWLMPSPQKVYSFFKKDKAKKNNIGQSYHEQTMKIGHTTKIENVHVNNNKVKRWEKCKRLLLNSLMSAIVFFSITIFFEIAAEYNYYGNLVFYIPFYGIIGIYYLFLIWKKQTIKVEDILLLPLFKKIKLFNDIDDMLVLKKRLITNIAPMLIFTVLISIIICFSPNIHPGYEYYKSSDSDGITIGSVLLFLPILAWIVLLFIEYRKKWDNNLNNVSISRIFDVNNADCKRTKMDIFSSLPKIPIPKWSVKEERHFTQEEKNAVKSAVIVASSTGKRVEFIMNHGSCLTSLPLDNSSKRNVGDSINMDEALIITYEKMGEGDVITIKY